MNKINQINSLQLAMKNRHCHDLLRPPAEKKKPRGRPMTCKLQYEMTPSCAPYPGIQAKHKEDQTHKLLL